MLPVVVLVWVKARAHPKIMDRPPTFLPYASVAAVS